MHFTLTQRDRHTHASSHPVPLPLSLQSIPFDPTIPFLPAHPQSPSHTHTRTHTHTHLHTHPPFTTPLAPLQVWGASLLLADFVLSRVSLFRDQVRTSNEGTHTHIHTHTHTHIHIHLHTHTHTHTHIHTYTHIHAHTHTHTHTNAQTLITKPNLKVPPICAYMHLWRTMMFDVMYIPETQHVKYGVATISRLLKIIGLFCRISCLL